MRESGREGQRSRLSDAAAQPTVMGGEGEQESSGGGEGGEMEGGGRGNDMVEAWGPQEGEVVTGSVRLSGGDGWKEERREVRDSEPLSVSVSGGGGGS